MKKNNEWVILNRDNVDNYVSKRIEWKSMIYEGNEGFYGFGLDGGECILHIARRSDRLPLHTTTIKGSLLDYAFLTQNNDFAYTDSDRFVWVREV